MDLQIKNSTGDPPRLGSSEQMRSVGQGSQMRPVGNVVIIINEYCREYAENEQQRQ